MIVKQPNETTHVDWNILLETALYLLQRSINTKIKIRTPQMGQNMRPKVAAWNYQKLTKWPHWGERWGGWFFSCPKHLQ